MTTREFMQAKFTVFVLLGMMVFFSLIEFVLMLINIWWPTEIVTALADWFLKAAIGPTVGATINTLVAPHIETRRKDRDMSSGAGMTATREVMTTTSIHTEPSPADQKERP